MWKYKKQTPERPTGMGDADYVDYIQKDVAETRETPYYTKEQLINELRRAGQNGEFAARIVEAIGAQPVPPKDASEIIQCAIDVLDRYAEAVGSFSNEEGMRKLHIPIYALTNALRRYTGEGFPSNKPRGWKDTVKDKLVYRRGRIPW